MRWLMGLRLCKLCPHWNTDGLNSYAAGQPKTARSCVRLESLHLRIHHVIETFPGPPGSCESVQAHAQHRRHAERVKQTSPTRH